MAVNTTLVWSNIVAALGAAIVSTLLTAWYFQGFPTVKAPGQPPSAFGRILTGTSVFAVETITYTPHILLLFGILADMFTMQGVYSIPSLIGLLSIPLNYVMKFFWGGLMGLFSSVYSLYNIKPEGRSTAASTSESKPESKPEPEPEEGAFSMFNPIQVRGRPLPAPPSTEKSDFKPTREKLLRTLAPFRAGAIENYDGCDVQGFSFLSSRYAPQSLVITATVFFYYIFDIVANRGWVDATSSIIMFAVVYIAETFIVGNCGNPISKWIRSLFAFLEGLLFGGASYGVVQAYYPTKLPSAVLPAFPRKTASDLTKRPDGTYVDENNVPWTILPSGIAIPDLSTGAGVSTALGESTGTAATPGACPSSSQ